jgi:hypothetical protein
MRAQKPETTGPDDPAPYIAMKQSGASPSEVFTKVREDGFRNFECTLLIAGVFDLSLDEARNVAHEIHRRKAAFEPPAK